MSFLLDAIQQNAVIFYGVVAFLGLFVGSFLNVVIYRLPVMMENAWRDGMREYFAEQAEPVSNAQGHAEAAGDNTTAARAIEALGPASDEKFTLSVPRSRCPSCNALIRWWQNIPVLSYVALAGKCHGCKTPISMRYPIIELASMLLSLAVAWQFGPSLQTVVGVVITWLFIAMTMIDFDHQLLPDSLTLPTMWIGLLCALIPVFADLPSAVIGAAAGYLVLWLVFHAFKLWTGKEGMGYGDFKLLAAIGALLGWQALLTVILLSSLVGGVVGLLLIALAGRDRNIPMPFGPFLAAAGWLAMMWGPQISARYYSLFG